MNEITLTQQPIIEFSSLDRMAQEVDKRLSVYKFNQIVVDEENYKSIKSLRADLNKELKEFEDVRKQIKKSLLEPYEEFEKAYKNKIADKYSNAEQSLKVLIDEVESGLKKVKFDEVLEYFEELKVAKELMFLTFDKTNIKVGLSDTVKALKGDVRNFVESIENDIELIKTQDYQERILVRYQNNLDVRQSIASVLQEVEQEKKLKPVEEVKEIKIDPIIEISEEVEEVITLTFKVSGTKKQLVALREYMKVVGIIYE